MTVSRTAALGVLVTLGLAGCSEKIDPRDGEVAGPIPVGVSVAPQRSTPQTGGLNLAAQDTTVATTGMPGITDTARAAAAPSATPADTAAAAGGVAPAAPAPTADTAAAPRPR